MQDKMASTLAIHVESQVTGEEATLEEIECHRWPDEAAHDDRRFASGFIRYHAVTVTFYILND